MRAPVRIEIRKIDPVATLQESLHFQVFRHQPAFLADECLLTTKGVHRGGRVTLAIHRCRKPTIAAVNGSAVGIGATMQLPCAIRIAYAQAKIGFVFARRGLVMEAASSFFLPRLIGFSRALHLTTTGATYKADSKLLEGLYSEVLETPEAVMARWVAEEERQNCCEILTE